jgi:LuxR family maltose regulon positive regulatory protein
MPDYVLEIRCVVALNLGIIYMAIWEPEMAWRTQLEAYEMAKGSRENLFVAVTALCQLAGIAVWQGKLREAERLCQQAIQLGTVQAGRPVSLPAVAYAHGWLAAVHNQRNEKATAQSHIEKALELVELVGPLATMIYARLFQARLALDAGDFSLAEELLNWAEEKSREYPIGGPIKTEWIVNRGRFYLERGDINGAAGWLKSQSVEAGELLEAPDLGDASLHPLRTRLPEFLLLARVLLAEGKAVLAEALLDKVCMAAEVWRYGESLLEGLALRAIAAASHGDRVDAARGLPYLERALKLAAPEGYVRPFLLAGEPIVKLLRQAIIQGLHPATAQKLLAELAEKEQRLTGIGFAAPGVGRATPDEIQLLEPLTEREKQVLRLLGAGLTSTQVAEELVISVSTARSYIKSIYGKLDAHSREEAIEKGRRCGQI